MERSLVYGAIALVIIAIGAAGYTFYEAQTRHQRAVGRGGVAVTQPHAHN